MCISCGRADCNTPDNDAGDPRRITLQELKDAAAADNLTLEQVIVNLAAGVKKNT